MTRFSGHGRGFSPGAGKEADAMRRIVPRHGKVLVACATMAALVLTGAGNPVKPKKPRETPLKVEETVSNLAYIVNGQDVQLEGVGLVTGLDRTGMDPPN